MYFMGLFRKDKVIDLSEKYRRYDKTRLKRQLKTDGVNPEPVSVPVMPAPQPTQQNENSGGGLLGFFNFGGSNTNQNSSNSGDEEETSDDKKKKLVKRLMDITEKLEELSNQIYRMEHRIEFIERRLKIPKDE